MKLHLLDDSIRMRLNQAEVNRIAGGQMVHSHTRFPGGLFIAYGVEPSDKRDITATLLDNVITVYVPAEAAKVWATTDQVSLTAGQPIDGGELNVLLEKDFESRE